MSELANLERLNLSENQICDLRILRDLKNLRDLDLNSNLLTSLGDLSELSKIHTLGLSRNLIRDPSPITKLPALRRLILSFNQIPSDQTRFKDLFREFESRGVYLNARNQLTYRPEAQSLVRSLIGHSQSNAILGNYLRGQGYARFVDLIFDRNIKQDEVDSACKSWEEALKFEKSINEIPFPGK